MDKNALGLIEVVGLAAGLEAADAAVKAANIELLGYELANGGGMVVIKLSGDVGAIKAAVEAGSLAAGKVGKVCATHVIPRPHSELGGMIDTKETVGRKGDCASVASPPTIVDEQIEDSQNEIETQVVEAGEEISGSDGGADSERAVEEPAATESPGEKGNCNLCGDPECTRKKGDPKVTCIHYNKNNKEDE